MNGILCKVRTACDYSKDILAFGVESEALADGTLQVKLEFPYGSPLKSAADWGHPEHHRTEVVESKDRELILKRTLDRDSYYVAYHSREASETVVSGHEVLITAAGGSLEFTVSFGAEQMTETAEARTVWESSRTGWKNYWEHGGIVELAKSKDKRAVELERRIILSQYLSAINSCGSRPPQETGLTCNSWYGKMHLEMYLWHCAWLPLWNQTEILERSLPWYASHLEEARKNAAVNGYAGARWPKMIASEGIDCPSPVAPLLIWQQPHIIYMLELAYQQNQSKDFLEKYWILIKESAEFMADFTVYNQETGTYDLVSPVIPVQECHRPEDTKNPAFEVAYWRFTLKLAVEWAERLGIACDPLWEKIADHMAGIPHDEHFYLAHDYCPDTFERFNRDHPSMVGAFGLISGDRVDAPMMKNTLNRVMDCWDYTTLWGWDFAMMAMTAVRLHDPEMAIEILLKDTPKNSYVTSGNNFQRLRPDLPLYLPGNGALLLAIPMMTAGYAGCTEALPGFPKNGLWTVEYENINPYFK
ncbi:MAG: glycoside hydrolase family 65 [Hungatella sp.]